MCDVFICQIVDLLAKKVTHTFMSSSYEHAVRQFQAFLKSFEGKIHNDDFELQVYSPLAIPESFSEAEQYGLDHPGDTYNGSEVMVDES